MNQNDPGRFKTLIDSFLSGFVVWCLVILGGSLVSGPPSGEYGALTVGAIFGLIAIADGVVSIVLVVLRFKHWRAWVSLGLSALTVAACMLRSVHHSGP